MIIGTRGSKLALIQSNVVSELLNKNGVITQQKIIKTNGDKVTNKPLYLLSNNNGSFVNELDDSLINNEIDIAVHSMKDIPSIRPNKLVISSVLKRDSPFDILITKKKYNLENIPDGLIIGTSSLRRKSQLKRYNQNIEVVNLRGNIDTRIKKLKSGYFDGIILSEAGIKRIGIKDYSTLNFIRLPINIFCPSPNQGAIAIVTR